VISRVVTQVREVASNVAAPVTSVLPSYSQPAPAPAPAPTPAPAPESDTGGGSSGGNVL
jgi:hypothetical protein